MRPLEAAPPAHADADWKRAHLSFCSHTQHSGRGGNLKKRSATARAGGGQTCRRSCIRGSAFPRFGSMNALDQKKSEHPTRTDTSSWEGHSPRAGAFGRLAVSGIVDFYVLHNINQTGGSL